MNSTFKRKPAKPKKCAVCRTEPVHKFGAVVCGQACAEKYVTAQWDKQERAKAKQVRKADKVRKEKIRKPSHEAGLTQTVVNRYVNLRDAGRPCISCGKPDRGVRNASHYKSRGSNSALRFNLWNINSSCYRCNKELGGNIAGYISGLKEKIGVDKVEWLNCHPKSREYSKEYLRRMRAIFSKKIKRLKSRQTISHE